MMWCEASNFKVMQVQFPLSDFLAALKSVKHLLLEFIFKQISRQSSGWRFAPLCCSPPASSGR